MNREGFRVNIEVGANQVHLSQALVTDITFGISAICLPSWNLAADERVDG